MSRGLSKLQNLILEVLDAKNGMTSTRTLKTAMVSTISNQSFYRSIQSLEKRGEIKFYRGGRAGGLVCRKHGNVLLIDVDSTIPNLALMKLSAYHKARGDTVDLQNGLKMADRFEKYDLVYISCIFTKNGRAARRLAKLFSTSTEVHLGGSGVDLKTTLPDDIEHLMPDYDLYPECDASYGYCSRGCPRHCDFCIVPRKEGKAHPVADIYEFWDKRHKKIVLLDNNLLAVPEHFKIIARQLIEKKLSIDFTQGLDIRLINDENAAILKKLRAKPYIRFAWDDIRSEPMVRRGIEILKKHGIKASMFYVLVGFNSHFEEDLYRVNALRELGQKSFVMVYERDQQTDKRYFMLRNWANARAHYFAQTFDEYCQTQTDGSYRKVSKENHLRMKAKKNPSPVLHGCEISSIRL